LIVTKHNTIESVATSFIASYCALWLSLLYDYIALLYNYLYEQINKETDASEVTKKSENHSDKKAGYDEVS
jgi:hypothetical protein